VPYKFSREKSYCQDAVEKGLGDVPPEGGGVLSSRERQKKNGHHIERKPLVTPEGLGGWGGGFKKKETGKRQCPSAVNKKGGKDGYLFRGQPDAGKTATFKMGPHLGGESGLSPQKTSGNSGTRGGGGGGGYPEKRGHVSSNPTTNWVSMRNGYQANHDFLRSWQVSHRRLYGWEEGR